MNLYVQVGLLLAVIVAFVVAAKYLKGGRVWILGVNISKDPWNGSLKKCRVKRGAALWKTREGNIAIPLAEDFHYGAAFVADVSEDQGRVIRLKTPDGSCYGMPGSRLWSFLFGDGLGQVARNQGTNYQTVLLVGIAAIGFILIGVAFAVYKIFELLQAQGAL